MAPGLQKLWAISKKYGPCQQWDGPEVQEKYWCFSKAIHVTFFWGGALFEDQSTENKQTWPPTKEPRLEAESEKRSGDENKRTR